MDIKKQRKLSSGRFVCGLKEGIKMELINECGRFITDSDGMLLKHICGEDVVKSSSPQYEDKYIIGTYNNLIIPEGVTGFSNGFFRFCVVKNTLFLPGSLKSIGSSEDTVEYPEHSCVFANCDLPDVILPEALISVGHFAFGHSHLKSVKIPRNLKSPYLRQFKDSQIDTLYLPEKYMGRNSDNIYSHRIKGVTIQFTRDEDFILNLATHCVVERLQWY